MTNLGYGEDAVSVSLEEIEPGEWTEKVYTPDIINGPGKLYKRPGYKPFEVPRSFKDSASGSRGDVAYCEGLRMPAL
jgi:hypothetical protein